MTRISVIIPALNEERLLEATILAATDAGVDEIIVSDGGSNDDTIGIARSAGAAVVTCASVRGAQLNAGAALATGEILLFVHADTLLPSSASADIVDAVQRGATSGGFLLSFTERSLRLRVAASLINLRTRITRCPWGDQAQFVTREMFDRSHGYREQALMEDYEFALRMKRIGSPAVLTSRVKTSGRRFLERGVVRTSALNWQVIIRYRLGADPEELARFYCSSSSSGRSGGRSV